MSIYPPHYTDEHLIKRGSSVDLIERCAAFVRQAGDFEGVLDYADAEGDGILQSALQQLTKVAMLIIRKETGS